MVRADSPSRGSCYACVFRRNEGPHVELHCESVWRASKQPWSAFVRLLSMCFSLPVLHSHGVADKQTLPHPLLYPDPGLLLLRHILLAIQGDLVDSELSCDGYRSVKM